MRSFTIGVSVISFSMVIVMGLFFVTTPSAAVTHQVTRTNSTDLACIWLDTAMSCDQKSSQAH